MGVVRNGAHKGETFIDLINTDRIGILGAKHANAGDFPLLVKIIDARDRLSVQVHPHDAYAREHDGYPFGKNEMWYVLEAPEDGYLIIGLKEGVERRAFTRALESGEGVEDYLNKLYVSRGDAVDIPAGLIHAIGGGIMIAEIQQNSDLTYRVYDYGRRGIDGKPRALQIEKALGVIDFDHAVPTGKAAGRVVGDCGRARITEYVNNPFFCVEKYEVADEYGECSDASGFHVFTCVGGRAEIVADGEVTRVDYCDSVFIPAALGDYIIKGPCELLKSRAT